MITSLIPPTNVGIDCLFEGHIDALLDHKTQENFIQCFPGGGNVSYGLQSTVVMCLLIHTSVLRK